MKSHHLIYILFFSLMLSLTSCREDPPGEMARSYEKNFVSHFGEIDPRQTWNVAERSNVRLELGDLTASKIQVLAPINDKAYRLTAVYDIAGGSLVVPFDMPHSTETIIIDIDGNQYSLGPRQTLTLRNAKPMAPPAVPKADEAEDLKWLMVAEDLGEDDDFDFNDLIMQIRVPRPKPIKLNAETLEWEEVEDSHMLQESTSSRAWDNESFADDNLLNHCVIVKAMAAGGTFKLWMHYYDGATDWIIGPGNEAGYICTTELLERDADLYEWHRWIALANGLNPNVYTSNIMLNTDWPNNKDASGQPLRSNFDDGVTIAIPISDEETYIAGIDGVISRDFTIEKYSETSSTPQNPYLFRVEKGFYFTVKDYKASYSQYGQYVELGNAIGHPKMGSAPQVFLIADQGIGTSTFGWLWPIERADLKDAYPYFSKWVSKGDDFADWYLISCTESLVYQFRK